MNVYREIIVHLCAFPLEIRPITLLKQFCVAHENLYVVIFDKAKSFMSYSYNDYEAIKNFELN